MKIRQDNSYSNGAHGLKGPDSGAGPVKQGNDGFTGLAVILPTRNRSDLAIRAAKSVLSGIDSQDVSLIISDNSTDAAESARINEFASTCTDSRLALVRPPSP